jgi:hypothetical protein
MFEEEGTWFLELKAKAPDQAFLTRRYAEEYGRYVLGVGEPPTDPAASEPRTFAAEADTELEEVGRNDAGPLQLGARTQDEAGGPV